MKKIRLLIVDDHPMVLEGMKTLLSHIPSLEIMGTAANAFEAITFLKNNLVDVAVVDINLPDMSGIELTTKIKKEFPEVKVLAMSTFKEQSYVTEMIKQGALGYLVKSASREE